MKNSPNDKRHMLLAFLRPTQVCMAACRAIGGPLRYNEVADRLIKPGLRTTFRGAIKLWHCHSGVAGDTAYAKRFADYVRGEGYNSCDYYGYLGAVTSYYTKRDSPDNEYHRMCRDAEGNRARASTRRRLIMREIHHI